MADELRFDGKVALITGAGNGLGRAHALLLASRGAKVVVNDLGGTHTGAGRGSAAADKVVDEIRAAGGEAVANYDSVEDGDKIVKTALDAFGRIDIVINNAGILRDVSYAKMSAEDWDLVYRVHVLGAHRVTAAAWPHLRDQKYGRVIFTASAAGIYGNFGQANYAMAKLGLVGLANTLAIEGRKNNVLVNTIAPIAGSRMTETVLPAELLAALKPELVSPLVALLCHEGSQETGGLFEVGGGFFSKLRWERSEGTTFRLGRKVSLEDLSARWAQVTDFGKSTHPDNITASMGPIMGNVEAGPTRGANQFIDVDAALGFALPEMIHRYTERDVSLYALGVGAGRDPLDANELALVYEMNGAGFRPLPTMIAAITVQQVIKLAMEGKQAPGLNYGLDRVLHGEQYTELLRPLPPAAKLTHKGTIKAIYDKGKGAVVVTEVRSYEEDGELLAINELSTFVRGAGGFGGERGPSNEITPPDRAPDAVIEEKTSEDQALLYRLSGDVNPLHADPGFAQNFGFARPILHGLCTFGFAARHVIKAFADNNPDRFKSIRARFVEPVVPGETLVTEMWRVEAGQIVFRSRVKERDKVVLASAAVSLYDVVPTKAPKARPAAAATAPSSAPSSASVFSAIGQYLAKNPEVGAKVGVVYLFKLSDPASAFTLDLKRNVVEPGETAKPGCTLELSDSDFLAMVGGRANPMKLFTSGKLKISGDVMASQKLDFLQKIDKAALASATAAPAAAPSQTGPDSASVFSAIGQYLAKNPEVGAKVGVVYLFKLSDPSSAFTLDLKRNVVEPGETAKPGCTLELSDADFLAMVGGKANPMKLFTSGKLKISGDVMASQKLDFLQKIDKAALASATAAPAAPTAPKASPTAHEAKAPARVAQIKARLLGDPQLGEAFAAGVVFQITDPAMTFSLVGRELSEGKAPGAAAVLTLRDESFDALLGGRQSAKELYQHGLLRVDGDVRLAHKLASLV
ncbi:MAG: SDR family NAD(P)-dependent oxidoreductase [Myxococcales bacterium]|nr:SDR family NAD(P)-dependent oxidoreductase [Myxococcales bacterium]